jgi:3-hydroxyisobutyrate dehydrogenase-like beta-hydroxyacid dehydrogenase
MAVDRLDHRASRREPIEIAQAANVLYVMVVNAEQVRVVLVGADGAAEALPEDAVVIVGSTIMPSDAREFSAELERRGFAMIDAPCSGGVQRAGNGTLSVMDSGPAGAFEKAAGVFDAVSANLFNLG